MGYTIDISAQNSGAQVTPLEPPPAKPVVPTGQASALSNATPQPVAAAGDSGSAGASARADHVHDHGTHSDPTDHAEATPSASGFHSAADKTVFDTRTDAATANAMSQRDANGDISYRQVRAVAAGVTIPSYSWVGDTGTGMYLLAAQQIGWAIGGVQAGRLTATDYRFGINSDSAKLYRAGTVSALYLGSDATGSRVGWVYNRSTGTASFIQGTVGSETLRSTLSNAGLWYFGGHATSPPGDAGLIANFNTETDTGTPVTVWKASNGTGSADLSLVKSRGTVSAPVIVDNGDTIGQLLFRAFDGVTTQAVGALRAVVTGVPGAGNVPTAVRIAVGSSGGTLANRLEITTTTISPLSGAVFSGDGSGLTTLNASNLASGTVPDARFPATLPALSGANLTNLNASQLASGTVPAARLDLATATPLPIGTAAVGTATKLAREDHVHASDWTYVQLTADSAALTNVYANVMPFNITVAGTYEIEYHFLYTKSDNTSAWDYRLVRNGANQTAYYPLHWVELTTAGTVDSRRQTTSLQAFAPVVTSQIGHIMIRDVSIISGSQAQGAQFRYTSGTPTILIKAGSYARYRRIS